MPNHVDEKIILEMEKHYQSSRQKRPEPEPTGQPPLTPMIDVTFQLLIFFLLTSTFSDSEGQIPGNLPATGGGSSDEPITPITIIIRNKTNNHDSSGRCKFIIDAENNRGDDIDAGDIWSLGGTEGKIKHATRDEGGEKLYHELKKFGSTPKELKNQIIKIKPEADVRWKFPVQAFNAARRVGFIQIGFAKLSG